MTLFGPFFRTHPPKGNIPGVARQATPVRTPMATVQTSQGRAPEPELGRLENLRSRRSAEFPDGFTPGRTSTRVNDEPARVRVT